MPTGYFAKVVDGVVDAVIRAEPNYIAENPDLFPEHWVEVPDMDQYPAIGYTWTQEGGFVAPYSPPELEVIVDTDATASFPDSAVT